MNFEFLSFARGKENRLNFRWLLTVHFLSCSLSFQIKSKRFHIISLIKCTLSRFFFECVKNLQIFSQHSSSDRRVIVGQHEAFSPRFLNISITFVIDFDVDLQEIKSRRNKKFNKINPKRNFIHFRGYTFSYNDALLSRL